MIIGHCGDLHVDENNRLDDARKALDFIAEEMARRKVDLILVGGDLSGKRCPHVATIVERNILTDFHLALAQQAPAVVIQGNHDTSTDFRFLGKLGAKHPITYLERPEVLEVAGALVACLPYPSKKWAMAAGVLPAGIEQQKQGMEEGLRQILMAWRLRAEGARKAKVPIVGLFHLNIAGSHVTGSEIMIGKEIELSPHDLAELEFDAGFLSHIHRSQEMAPGWNYAGAPYRQDHGEEDYLPSFVVAEVRSGKKPKIEHVLTPSRRLVTVDARWVERDGVWCWDQPLEMSSLSIPDADVRIRTEVPEEQAALADVAALEAHLRELGANAVKVDRRTIPKVRIRSEAILEARTIEQKLLAYWESLGKSGPSEDARKRALARLLELEAEERGEKEEAAA